MFPLESFFMSAWYSPKPLLWHDLFSSLSCKCVESTEAIVPCCTNIVCWYIPRGVLLVDLFSVNSWWQRHCICQEQQCFLFPPLCAFLWRSSKDVYQLHLDLGMDIWVICWKSCIIKLKYHGVEFLSRREIVYASLVLQAIYVLQVFCYFITSDLVPTQMLHRRYQTYYGYDEPGNEIPQTANQMLHQMMTSSEC